jgi:hypothetical protein
MLDIKWRACALQDSAFRELCKHKYVTSVIFSSLQPSELGTHKCNCFGDVFASACRNLIRTSTAPLPNS